MYLKCLQRKNDFKNRNNTRNNSNNKFNEKTTAIGSNQHKKTTTPLGGKSQSSKIKLIINRIYRQSPVKLPDIKTL